ncbi:MAG: hypothetical protein U1F48_17785 [Burkholderiales bacterium]
MALAGQGAVIVWNDITAEGCDDFFEWHARQHMPERINLPGFNRGRRCVAVDASVEFLTLYEVDDVTVLDSEVYRTRLANPTPWSLKVMPHFRNNVRGGCRVLFTAGPSQGGCIATLRMTSDAARRPGLVDALVTQMLPAVAGEPRITGAHLLVNDPALSGGQVGQRQGRFITQPDVVVVVEGSTVSGVRAAIESHCNERRLMAAGADAHVVRDTFRQEYSLQKLAHGALPVPADAEGWRTSDAAR